jgi:hypothetical protein
VGLCSTLRLFREMGRWAQAARRGGRGTAAGPPGPPPAPVLSTAATHCLCTAQGGDDTGGTYQLWWSELYPYEWEPFDIPAPWEAVWEWGTVGTVPEGYYYATETGNGTSYVGTSPDSNILPIGGG